MKNLFSSINLECKNLLLDQSGKSTGKSFWVSFDSSRTVGMSFFFGFSQNFRISFL